MGRMAFSAAGEVPWACVFRLQLRTLLSRQSGCDRNSGISNWFSSPVPCPAWVCWVWPGGMFALASGGFPLADWSLLCRTDTPGCWLERPP